MQRLEFRAMGCQMLAAIDAESRAAGRLLAGVPGWFADWEQRLSRFRTDSELSLLNRSAGNPVQVSAVLWEVVQAALAAARASGGLVDPTLLGALEAAGYDRTFEEVAAEAGPDPMPARAPVPASGLSAIVCDESTRTVALRQDARLDLGGIAKGWAADTAARRLGVAGPALVDAGGDIALSGPPAGQGGWPIGVADPHDTGGQIALLVVPEGGVATSGRDYRRWQRGGASFHHILDPRTGRPAETDILAATVVAPTALEAETAAKVALILGSREGAAWLEARPRLAGLLVDCDGRTVWTRRMKRYLWS
ncbi:MAG: FAD:protein FMN transferase [Sphingomonadaceae bacterium]